MKIWALPTAGLILLALVRAGMRTLRSRPAAGTRLARIVLDVFGDDWACRLGRTPEELRAAVLRTPESAVARELDALISVVNVRFERDQEHADVVGADVLCAYAENGEAATARLRLPWDDTPADVRAELLRNGAVTAVREWTVPVT